MPKIAVITENDTVWALGAWETAVPALRAEGYDWAGLWVTPRRLGKYRAPFDAFWYLKTFGMRVFFLLAVYAVSNKISRLFRTRSFKHLCRKERLHYGEADGPNNPSFIEWLRKEKVDVLVIMVNEILKAPVLETPLAGIVNKHASLLPSCRGLFPYFWTFLEDGVQGVSYYRVEKEIDEGPLLYQEKVPAKACGSMVSFYHYLFSEYARMLSRAVKNLGTDIDAARVRDADGSYHGLPDRNDYRDFRKKGGKIIRAGDLLLPFRRGKVFFMNARTPIALNINFDSLGEALGFPPGFRDPSYFEVFDRFAALAGEYGFSFSIYVIGKDLEDPEIFARVREWSQAGHEIGNHGWSHRVDLGALRPEEIRKEIERSHEIILKCTGRGPEEFTAPAWSASKTVFEELIRLNYLYDASVFPSALLYPAVLKAALNHWRVPHLSLRALNRRDWLLPLKAPAAPFELASAGGKLLVLPLPAAGRPRLCFWHTLGFLFGREYAAERLRYFLKHYDFFYFLMHPCDLLGRDDFEKLKRWGPHGFERAHLPLPEKTARLREMFQILKASGRPVVTMERLAREVLEKPDAALKTFELKKGNGVITSPRRIREGTRGRRGPASAQTIS